jgi:leader peptidase (prepilin peptidase) / N-methyltransferase
VVFVIYLILLIFIGACSGSFCHAMGIRLANPARFRKKRRSICDACGRTLHPYELVPIFSYLCLKGRCRTCHHKLSPTLLLVELGTGLFYIGLWLVPTFPPTQLLLLLVYHLLLIAAISDYYFMVIPNRLLIMSFFLSFLLLPWLMPIPLSSRLLGLSLGLGLPALILALTRGGLGGGDVKLFMLLGWLLGSMALLHLMIIACLTGILGFLFLPFFRKKDLPIRLPFGPFIFLGFILEGIWHFSQSTGISIFL